ncbi:MAG TPA: redoxin family protein [Nitrososphaera sp.]|jgi:thiol-disulfide isomerase/thioredoxin|nr:redoxin family protein [Nitrososphaera sp.]
MQDVEMDLIPAIPAPEFREISDWANSHPLSMKGMRGKVVLVDCWTYTCIFCLRTIPIMRRLQQKYGNYGLQVVEAHSAEYHFATDPVNIRRALSRYNITDVPVAFDSNNKTWEAFGNMYWPKHILIDPSGLIRYEHAGYGGIEDFEDVVVELLEEAGKKPVEEKEQGNPEDEIYDTYGMHFYGIAPEICVGYSRLRRFGNNQTVKPDAMNVMVDPGSHDPNVVYLRGRWIWQREGVQFSPGGKDKNPALIMKYNAARRVHGIMGTSDGRPGKVEIKLDGNHLTKEQLGKDARIDNDDGISTVNIEWPFMHNLVRSDNPETREIEIIPRSDNVVFYTFVFG